MFPNRVIQIGPYSVGEENPPLLILGPCVIESEMHALKTAERLCEIMSSFPFSFIFKASYDKANRTSLSSFRGPGIKKGLPILYKIKESFHIPVTTDVHTPQEAREAAQICDLLQIPAFLCRQTDLILAAGNTQRAVNVKKGQFLAPWDVAPIVEKIKSTGNNNILLTERGTSFGYNNLVFDLRSIPIMQSFNVPVCFDASHSVQLPGGNKTSTGGQKEFILPYAKAAMVTGADALFLECHLHPKESKSDKDSIYPIDQLPFFLEELYKVYEATRCFAKA